jgi:Fanconi anemia group I protein
MRKLAGDVHYHLGDVEEDVEVPGQCNYSIVSSITASPTIMLPLINHLEHVLDNADWMGNRLRSHVLSGVVVETAKSTEARETLENAVCVQLAGAVFALHHLSQSAIMHAATEPLLKVLTRLYVSLGTAAKYFLALHGRLVVELSGQFEKLVKLTATRLQPQVYSLITYIQSTQGTGSVTAKKGKGRNTPLLKGRVLRETKTVPNLIYYIEQYEKFLIQLSTKSKVNLMENFKRSTSRDFRINTAALDQALNEQPGSDDEPEIDRENENTAMETQQNQERKASRGNTKRTNTKKGDQSRAKKLKV